MIALVDEAAIGKPLLQPVMRGGKRPVDFADLMQARACAATSLRQLPKALGFRIRAARYSMVPCSRWTGSRLVGTEDQIDPLINGAGGVWNRVLAVSPCGTRHNEAGAVWQVYPDAVRGTSP
jgi:hypothetical protein